MPESFVSQPGASRWIVTSPNPRRLDFDMQQGKRLQLLQEAASMVPDEKELTSTLLNRKLSPYETTLYSNYLNNELSNYLTEYRKNPFYAFQREGINQARNMRRIVTDPRLKELENSFEKSEKEFEAARTKELLSNVEVNDGRVKVIKDGQVQWIRPDDFDPSVHKKALSIGESYESRINNEGFINDPTPFTVNMQKLSETMKNVRDHFTNLGHTEQENFMKDLGAEGSELKTSFKNNYAQIEAAKRSLMSKGGLSQADWNTLLSEVYTKTLGRGIKISETEANREVLGMIQNIALGRTDSSVGMDVNPLLKAAVAKKDARTEIAKWDAAMSGQTAPVKFTIGTPGNNEMYAGYALQGLENESSSNYKGEDGAVYPKQNVNSLDKMFGATNRGTMYVPSAKDGSFQPVDISQVSGEVQVVPNRGTKRPSTMPVYVNSSTGEIVSAKDKNKLEEQGVRVDVKQALYVPVTVMGAGRNWISGEQERYKKIDQRMDELGYSALTLPEEQWNNYYQNIDNTNASSENGNAYELDAFFLLDGNYDITPRMMEGLPTYQNLGNAYLGPNSTSGMQGSSTIDKNFALNQFSRFGTQ